MSDLDGLNLKGKVDPRFKLTCRGDAITGCVCTITHAGSGHYVHTTIHPADDTEEFLAGVVEAVRDANTDLQRNVAKWEAERLRDPSVRRVLFVGGGQDGKVHRVDSLAQTYHFVLPPARRPAFTEEYVLSESFVTEVYMLEYFRFNAELVPYYRWQGLDAEAAKLQFVVRLQELLARA